MQIATGQLQNITEPVELMKRYCGTKIPANGTLEAEKVKCKTKVWIYLQHWCKIVLKHVGGHLFALMGLDDFSSGLILLIISLALLIICLLGLVKLLKSVLGGQIASAIRRTVNADLPRPFHCLTGYVTILIGAFLTILVQSSSVFTSTLTPLVAIGVLSLDRMYPLTLGSNVGTTFTSILAALASPAQTLPSALQMALCHLFFNLSGILLFYPIPVLRQCPIGMAKILGETTARYRWFGFVYIMGAFFVIPAAVFALSLGGPTTFLAVGAPIGIIFGIIIIINVLQAKFPKILPEFLHNWEFLPECLHSLDPYDRFMVSLCLKFCPCWARFVAPPKSATPSLAPSLAASRVASRAASKVNLRDEGRNTDSKERLPPV